MWQINKRWQVAAEAVEWIFGSCQLEKHSIITIIITIIIASIITIIMTSIINIIITVTTITN